MQLKLFMETNNSVTEFQYKDIIYRKLIRCIDIQSNNNIILRNYSFIQAHGCPHMRNLTLSEHPLNCSLIIVLMHGLLIDLNEEIVQVTNYLHLKSIILIFIT